MSKSTWRLRCDPRSGEHNLIVEYSSNAPPAEHSEEHRRILEKAREVLIGGGIDHHKVRISYQCLTGTTLIDHGLVTNESRTMEPERVSLGRD